MEYKIDSDVKISKLNSGRKLKYPFDKMLIGDSIYVENVTQSSLCASSSSYSKRHNLGWQFSVRKFNSGYRIFRIK